MTKDKNIFIKNIYYMLSYAFTSLNQGEYENIAAEEFENIHSLFAAILAKGIGKQIKQGLFRDYIKFQKNAASVKGKINIQGSIQNILSRKRVLTCEYDELSENNIFNQILKTTVMLLLNHENVQPDSKSVLKKEMLFFSNVDLIDPVSIRWSGIRFHKNNSTYRMLIILCQFIIEGMLLTTDSGEYRLASFLNEQRMNRLFEKFILEYYIKEWPTIKSAASQVPWSLDDGMSEMLPVMQTDVSLQKNNTVLIIDAKYYSRTTQNNFGKNTIHSNNLYQIFTYVKNRDYQFGDKPHKVSGMLLYAKTDENIIPDNVYQMHGNQITVRTLDLSMDFSEIRKQLDSIAKEHFESLIAN